MSKLRKWKIDTPEYQRILNGYSNLNRHDWIMIFSNQRGGLVGQQGYPTSSTYVSDYYPTKALLLDYNVESPTYAPVYTTSELNPFNFEPDIYKELTQSNIVYIVIFDETFWEQEMIDDMINNYINGFVGYYSTNLRFERYDKMPNVLIAKADDHYYY